FERRGQVGLRHRVAGGPGRPAFVPVARDLRDDGAEPVRIDGFRGTQALRRHDAVLRPRRAGHRGGNDEKRERETPPRARMRRASEHVGHGSASRPVSRGPARAGRSFARPERGAAQRPRRERAARPCGGPRSFGDGLLRLGVLPLVAADHAVLVPIERAEILALEHRELGTADQPVGVAIRFLERRQPGRELPLRRVALRLLSGRRTPLLFGARTPLLFGARALPLAERAGLRCRRLLLRIAALSYDRALLRRLAAPICRTLLLGRTLLVRRALLLREASCPLPGRLRRARLAGPAVGLRAALPLARLLLGDRPLLLRGAAQRVGRFVQLVGGPPQRFRGLGRTLLRARL